MIKDIAHIALNPLDMDKTVEFFQNVSGWKKGDIKSPEPEIEKSLNKNLWLYAPDGNKIELMMLDPDLPQSKA